MNLKYRCEYFENLNEASLADIYVYFSKSYDGRDCTYNYDSIFTNVDPIKFTKNISLLSNKSKYDLKWFLEYRYKIQYGVIQETLHSKLCEELPFFITLNDSLAKLSNKYTLVDKEAMNELLATINIIISHLKDTQSRM